MWQVFRALLVYGDKLRKALVDEPGLEPLRLSLRVLLRIAKHLRQRPEDVHGALSRAFAACLRFLPNSSQEAVLGMLQMALRSTGAPTLPWTSSVPDTAESRRRREDLRELEYMAIQARMMGGGDMVDEAREKAETDRKKQREDRLRELRKLGQQGFSRKALDAASISGGVLRIGDVSCPLRTPSRPELVPDVAFVDIPQQTEILKDMLLDWSLGHHLLLVGNQGVGKNKLTDRLLGLLQCEREYVQLHRDTTVQSLTLSPCLKAGVVTWEDSPLLRAVKHGRCLVVDEADKAPLEVVCVLKALSEDGELSLSDGRTIVRPDSAIDRRDVVRMSSDFRLIVLANRPGYPFMGHDFFKLCGDVFSCHVVDNPDIASEVALLRSVGPDVPEEQVLQLSVLFAELREMVEAGQLAYPYSTRELVKLVSHAQRFPKDRLEELASTVFAFDLADEKKRTPLLGVLQRHGIATTEESIRLLDGYTSGDMSLKLDEGRDKSKDVVNKENPDGTRPPDMAPGGPKHGKWDGQEHIGGNQFAGGSGGTGTAGLGGRWGPYRLDVGQKLVQVSEDSKKGLDEETKRKAQEMADDAYRKRLAEMKMSLKEGQAYAALRDAVASQIQEMKVCLESQEARERERQWLKNQSTGELDENRLVDSITGCKTVYMRRGQPDSFAFGRQQHPKRITFVMDISGSMYTFNRIDRRLQRLQEVATFIFESFAGFEEKYQYRMVGHSGTGPEERLVEWAKPPLTDKDRLEIAKTMEAHAQFCYPGDHTLEATMRAIKEIGTQEADERLVLVVSDADLQRYNIDVRQWNQILQKDPSVKAYVILISNNVDEARGLTRRARMSKQSEELLHSVIAWFVDMGVDSIALQQLELSAGLVSHYRQYPPGTQYVYSYFESRGCDREGWDSVCFFGLQYFLKRYLTGQVVTREKIEQAAKIYSQHFGDGTNDNPDLFYREGWEYILEKHGGRLPVKIKALPEGTVVPVKTVLITVVNTDPECYWLTNFLETLLVQVWFPMTVCTNSRYQKLSIQKYLEETGCEDWKPPGGAAYKLHDFGFRGVSSVESAATGGLGHLVNFMGSDTVIALLAAEKFYGAKRAVGTSIPASEHSTITSWGVDGELDAMRNMLDQYPTGLVACVSDSFDVFKACREYWGDALKDKIKGRISDTSFGQLVVRPDSGDPEETCVAIMKILLEQFAEEVTETKTGHKLLPPYIRVIQGDGVDYQSIPKILQRFKDEGIAAANITFGSGGALLQKVNRDTFKIAFKCAEVTLESGEAREVFKDPLTDDGKASKKGRLTLQKASDITTYSEEDVYKPRQGVDGVKGGTGFLHFTPDGNYVTVASGKHLVVKVGQS
ncbi:Nicotinamide phosphoribosyltransferase (NAmPRTase) (Nampt) (Pre-B-cell colony-enhancing factor 1 homolog) (PBEF) (Visfatin) [Durusdinium trenchii]|uniref:Nicotinamide phosphoribosyltransferase n=1 Tax=Durusdinium trenchii TaxID=1381693 RepID=A0ABP0M050_9DINO